MILKFLKILTAIFFLLPPSSYANPNVAILNWQENIQLTTTGRISDVAIKGKIRDLPTNQEMTSFSIIFDEKQNLKITRVFCDNQPADFTFSHNALSVKFPKAKKTNSSLALYFTYEERYDKINKFLRQESINIPNFAVGANAQVVINFPGYLESATLNPNVTKTASSFVYRNIVPENGVEEIIKLTAAQSVWDVAIKIKVSADKALNDVIVTIPTYFQNAGQKVENFTTKSSIKTLQQSTDGSKKVLKFNTAEQEINIENRAKISTGKNNRTMITRNPGDYLKVSPDEAALLTPILEKIKRDPKYRDLPLYAKIGRFVHEFLKYDLSYVGRLPKVREILQNPIGVCTEYSRLYNGLARIAGISSLIIDGAACGEYDKCMGHSWNMIFYNGQWIDVDATWDLMSGVVSSSHIFFNDDEKGAIETQYFDDQKTLNSRMDFEMKSL
jgi:hypothetical protein